MKHCSHARCLALLAFHFYIGISHARSFDCGPFLEITGFRATNTIDSCVKSPFEPLAAYKLPSQDSPSMPSWGHNSIPIWPLGLVALAIGAAGGGAKASSMITPGIPPATPSPPTCGGGLCDPSRPASQFVTSEYSAQYGENIINASDLYSYGGSGLGVTVAVFDSGLYASHPEFIGRVAPGGFDYQTDTLGVSVDPDGHGTHVSGIIAANKNEIGMHGVAYEAQILPVRIIGIPHTDTENADAFSRVFNQGVRITNHSWALYGDGSDQINLVTVNQVNSMLPQSLGVIRSTVHSGAVQVFATANQGLTEVSIMAGLPHLFPDLEPGWLAVTSVDSNGLISSFANKCGLAADWCIAAPGNGIYSTYNNGGYVQLSGTSMAAPHVSGAIAGLKSRFPNLSFQQIRDRLLATANKTGPYASVSIYGQGLMDLGVASAPVGGLVLPTSATATGSSVVLQQNSLTLSPSVYQALKNQLPATILVLDGYQRAPFYLSTNQLVKARFSKGLPINQWMQSEIERFKSSVSGRRQWLSLPLLNKQGFKSIDQFNWVMGKSHQLEMNNALGLGNLQVLPSDSNIMSLTYQTGGIGPTFSASTWADVSPNITKAKSRTVDQTSVAQFQHGATIGLHMGPQPNSRLSIGLGFGKPFFSMNADLSGEGAFSLRHKTSPFMWFSWLHAFQMDHGALTVMLDNQFTDRKQDGSSLLEIPNHLKQHDFKMGLSWVNHSHRLEFSRLQSQYIGRDEIQIMLPTSISETGQVGYSVHRLGVALIDAKVTYAMSYALTRRGVSEHRAYVGSTRFKDSSERSSAFVGLLSSFYW